jgi:2-methylcitrate dehydratase PrpD
MAEVEVLAKYVRRARLEDLSDKALEQLKIRVLDSISVAIGALAATPIAAVRKLTALLRAAPLNAYRWRHDHTRSSGVLQQRAQPLESCCVD